MDVYTSPHAYMHARKHGAGAARFELPYPRKRSFHTNLLGDVQVEEGRGRGLQLQNENTVTVCCSDWLKGSVSSSIISDK